MYSLFGRLPPVGHELQQVAARDEADGPSRSSEEGDRDVPQKMREMLKYNYGNQPIEPTARPLEPRRRGGWMRSGFLRW